MHKEVTFAVQIGSKLRIATVVPAADVQNRIDSYHLRALDSRLSYRATLVVGVAALVGDFPRLGLFGMGCCLGLSALTKSSSMAIKARYFDKFEPLVYSNGSRMGFRNALQSATGGDKAVLDQLAHSMEDGKVPENWILLNTNTESSEAIGDVPIVVFARDAILHVAENFWPKKPLRFNDL